MLSVMSLPVVAIVGRPNVGKSSLLNALARERISIVDPRAGVTRDRVSTVIELADDRYIELVDTGGIGIVDDDHLEAHVEAQIQYALARASVILFVVDAAFGLTPMDKTIAQALRKLSKPLIVVANKVDAPKHEPEAAAAGVLGLGEPMAVSALHGLGRSALCERLLEILGDEHGAAPPDPAMKLAIVGKRNAGKSTLVNALAGETRVIVSETPGTTRDAIDVRFRHSGLEFVAIDTAGVRKKSKMNDIDFYSHTRALRSIERADVVMLLIDATVPVAEPDLKLAGAIREAAKPMLFAINKWDLVGDQAEPSDFSEYLAVCFAGMAYAPVVFMTARDGTRVDAAVDVACDLHRQATTRVPTAQLNAALEAVLQRRAPSAKYGARPVRIYYATQVSTAPPTIVFFCNEPGLVTENYRRFMENRLREILPFREIPIRMWFRPRRAPARAGGRRGSD